MALLKCSLLIGSIHQIIILNLFYTISAYQIHLSFTLYFDGFSFQVLVVLENVDKVHAFFFMTEVMDWSCDMG